MKSFARRLRNFFNAPVLKRIESLTARTEALETSFEKPNELISLVRDLIARTEAQLLETRRLQHIEHFGQLNGAVTRFHHAGQEVYFFVPDALFDSIQYLIVHLANFYEIELLEQLKEFVDLDGKTVVDAGANIGNHSVYFCKIRGASRCVSFEANPYTASILQRNVDLNGLSKTIEVLPKAVSDRDELLSIEVSPVRNLGATTLTSGGSLRPIQATTIDALNLAELDLLKIDVEGMAAKVISGARQSIRQHKPVIFVELFEHEFAYAEAELIKLGYHLERDLGDSNYIFVPRRQ